MEIDAIEDVTLSEYNDRQEFEGHTPMGLHVRQTVYSFENRPYQVFNFEVTNLGDRGSLKGVYLGVVGAFPPSRHDPKLRYPRRMTLCGL